MKIQKITSITNRIIKKSPKLFQQNNVSIQMALPIVSVPLIAYNLKGSRDMNLSNFCQQAIQRAKEKFNKGEISQSQYNSQVRDIKNYYENAKNLPSDVSSYKIKQNEPTFNGNDSDYSVYDGNNDDDCCDCDSDDDCCDSDSDSDDDCCDSDCDSGDILASSF